MILPAKGETARKFELWKAYLAMEHPRSLRKLAKQMNYSFRELGKLSVKYSWAKRIEECIVEEQEREQRADEQAKLERAREREKRKAKIQEDAWQAGQEAIGVARSILRNARAHIKPTEAARLLSVGDSLCRLALGMPVTRGEITGEGGRALNPVAPAIMTVIHQFDGQSKEVERIQNEFIAKHPDDPAVIGRNGGPNGQ